MAGAVMANGSLTALLWTPRISTMLVTDARPLWEVVLACTPCEAGPPLPTLGKG